MNPHNLNGMTVKELLALPEAASIVGRHKMKKADLIAALVALSPVEAPVVEETPAVEPEVVIVTERQMISPAAALATIASMGMMNIPGPSERSFGGPRMSDAERRRLKELRKKKKAKAKMVKASKKRNRKAA